MATELTPAERQALKARAHRLDPLVLVGGEGLRPGVVGEVERALATHELIKIRVMGIERAGREALLAAVCAATGCAPVQHIGKILVVYRRRPEAPPEPPPARAARPPGKRARRGPAPPPRRAKIRSR